MSGNNVDHNWRPTADSSRFQDPDHRDCCLPTADSSRDGRGLGSVLTAAGPAAHHLLNTTAQVAPPTVATRVTASLVIHFARPSTIAPSRLSSAIPKTPPAQTGASGVASHVVLMPAITADPVQAAIAPSQVTPPEVPGETVACLRRMPAVMSRGGVLLSNPISVAHVSAVDAAIAPAKATVAHGAGCKAPYADSTVATAPLANTCAALRPAACS